MNWEIQVILGRCQASGCHHDLVPGEPVRLNRVRKERWCWVCAWKRLMESVPRGVDLPLQFVPKITATRQVGSIYVAEGRKVAPNFETFDRGEMGGTLRKSILSRRELERANANDPKLKAAGEQ